MVKKIVVAVPVALLFLTTAAFVHAQGGCVDSPENPTALLAVVGGVGVLIARYRASRRR